MKNLLIVLLCCSGWLTAQNDSKAQAYLNEVSGKMQAYDNLIIDFKYSLENKSENIQQETRGDVTLKKDKYLLNLMGITKLFDGKTTYTIVPEDEEITISSLPEEEASITPSKLLSFYKKGYAFKWDSETSLNGRKIQYIKLLPTDPRIEINYILLGIDVQTKHIYNLIEVGKNGTTTTLSIQSLKVNQPLPEKLFIFDASKYPNYYINKLD